MRRLVIVLSLGTGLSLLAGPARADVPPDPNSADAHCTPAEQCKTGTLCPYAWSPGGDENESKKVGEDCRAAVKTQGLERRCRNGGNYGGDELFCPPGATGTWSAGGGAPAPEPEPTKPTPSPSVAPDAAGATAPPAKAGNCSTHGGGPGGALLLALLGLWSRRRR